VADWFAGVDREKTRTSAFARVMTPSAAPPYSGFQMRETSRLLKLKLELSTPGIKR
jgi:hypothetical protein